MLLSVVLAGGCAPAGAPGDATTAPSRPPVAELSTSGAPAMRETPSPPKASSPPTEGAASSLVTMAFAGDVHFEGNARGVLADSAPLITSLRDTVGDADFAMANLETSIGTGGRAMPGKQYTFKAPPSALQVLASAGFDAVSMANNHAVDFGDEVLAQTLRAKENSPIPIAGIGGNASQAFAPVEVRLGAARVAVLASSQVRDLTGLNHAASETSPGIAANVDPAQLLAAVRTAATTHDVVVVVMHWGTEQSLCADDRQRQTAADLVDAGADIIVGGHGHRPQGSGWLASSYVAYGLGNFVWYQNGGGNGDSGVLRLTLDATYAAATTRSRGAAPAQARQRSVVTAAAWVPMRIGADGVPRRPSAAVAKAASTSWAESARCGSLALNAPLAP